MANNRLYIYNKETEEAFMLAKSFGSRGWEIRQTKKALQAFLSHDDWDSCIDGGPSNFVLLTEDELFEIRNQS